MSNEPSPDVWRLLFEQTPTTLRWMLGVLSAGLFTIASYVYRRNMDRVDRMEKYIDERIRETETKIDNMDLAAQRRDEHTLKRLNLIDGRIISTLRVMASKRYLDDDPEES